MVKEPNFRKVIICAIKKVPDSPPPPDALPFSRFWASLFSKFRKMPPFFAKNHPGQGKLFAKKGRGGWWSRGPIFEKSSYVPLKKYLTHFYDFAIISLLFIQFVQLSSNK